MLEKIESFISEREILKLPQKNNIHAILYLNLSDNRLKKANIWFGGYVLFLAYCIGRHLDKLEF